MQFLRRAVINEDEGTVTLPLYEGHNACGETAWYVLTDVSDRNVADKLGLTYTAKMRYADQGRAVRSASLDRTGAFVFSRGKVDFSPVRALVPGDATPFPPRSAQPGSIGDQDYTPIVKTSNGIYRLVGKCSSHSEAWMVVKANRRESKRPVRMSGPFIRSRTDSRYIA